MARYAIGDIQGCFDTLEALLARIGFDPGADELWLAGDLVNRGPRSADVLRWARGLGDRVTAVLGNHDLHLLKMACGARRPKSRDTAQSVLDEDDADELIDWLRTRPFVHIDGDAVLVHAGLLPGWSPQRARALAGELEAVLAGDDWRRGLSEIARAPRVDWRDDLMGPERLRAILDALTTVRACDSDGRLLRDYAGAPDGVRGGYRPWFAFPERASATHTVVFGHWAMLGLHVEDRVICLDSGCVWGESLTAMQLPERRVTQHSAVD